MSNVLKFYGFEFSSATHASPELSSAQSCFKGVIAVANLIFLIFGAVLCGVGAYALQTKAGSLAGNTLPEGIIVMGVFIMLVSFLGCFAAYKENRAMLAIYFGFLLIFDIILFAVGIAVYAENDSAEEYMSDGWCVATDKVVEALQEYFTCCGLYQFNDSISRIASDGTVIAAGCSIIRPSAVHYITCPSGLTQDNGQACLPILSSKFQSSYIAAGASAIAFAVVMAAGMIVVCILMSAIKQKKHLEEIRKLHRKLREAKEDPTHAALRARDEEEGSISAYDDVDLGAQEPIDTDVAINVGGAAGSSSVSGIVEGVEDEYNEDDTGASSYAGESTFTAQPPKKTKKSKKAAATKYREPEPEVEEQPYEDTYEEEQTGGYAHHVDEYDEEY